MLYKYEMFSYFSLPVSYPTHWVLFIPWLNRVEFICAIVDGIGRLKVRTDRV